MPRDGEIGSETIRRKRARIASAPTSCSPASVNTEMAARPRKRARSCRDTQAASARFRPHQPRQR